MARRLECTLFLPGRAPADVFPFFADAMNLERLTPASLRFHVTTPPPIVMGAGTLIDYRLRVRGLPFRWRSRITRWDPPHAFGDEQVRGPYLRWDHLHTFEARDGGTVARDVVDYAVFGGFLVEPLVRMELRRIFAFRSEVMAREFGAREPARVTFSRT
jgi:ligand-binding SRPBCC domain-containing protein